MLICSTALLFSCEKPTPEPKPEPEPTPTPAPTISVNPASVDIAAEGGSATVYITTNQDSWSYETTDEWITVEANIEAKTLTITADINTDEVNARTASIKFTAPAATKSSDSAPAPEEVVPAEAVLSISQAAYIPTVEYVNLSETGTANCYIIKAEGKYAFNATVKGNGATTDGLDAPETLSPANVKLVWQSTTGMISELTLNEGIVEFKAANQPGNALIAVTDATGAILWNWHIWFPEVAVEGLAMDTGYEMMNINLGATTIDPNNVSSYGYLYQWGRKDPFPGCPSLTGTSATLPVVVYDIDGNPVSITNSSWYDLNSNNLAYAIANPTIVISNYAQYSGDSNCRDWLTLAAKNDALWGNASKTAPGEKTIYDPCPEGWMVPPMEAYAHFTSSGGYEWVIENFNVADVNDDGIVDINDYQNGWTFYLDKENDITSFFPAATRYDGSYAMLMGSMAGLWGNYWTNTTGAETMFNGGATGMAFNIKDQVGNEMITATAQGSGGRADAYSVRCVKIK